MGTKVLSRWQRRRARAEFGAFIAAARAPKFRTMRQFALEEIIMPPGGPRANERFSVDEQPWPGLWLDEVDSDRYVYHVLVAMVQGGKTFAGWVLPVLYYLFERNENVACGIPQMEMAGDKWKRDLEPVILASRFHKLMPTTGAGSKGGEFDSIIFKNGCVLKFLSAKGGDEKRSGTTFRILVMTEVDKYDTPGEASREGGPVNQMIARLESHPMLETRVFMECTASFPTGMIWTTYNSGTASRIALQCHACGQYSTPEREHLRGWQEAKNELEARQMTYLVCPLCDVRWSNEDLKLANKGARLVHRGQEIRPDGTIVGESPQTLTLGFRVNVLNNNLKPLADIGYKEWQARNNQDRENSEKTLLQFQWAKPWGGESTSTGINEEIVASRLTGLPQLILPEDAETLVIQVDLHLRWHYYTILVGSRSINPAWSETARDANGQPLSRFMAPHYTVVDYGVVWNPDAGRLGNEAAILLGLEELAVALEARDYITSDGRLVSLDLGLVDAGYHQELGLQFVSSRGGLWRLVKGQGRKEKGVSSRYMAPKKRTADIRPGDHWYDSRQPAVKESGNKPWWLVISDTDYWMHRLHSGFMSLPFLIDESGQYVLDELGHPIRRPGSIALFGDDPQQHLRSLDAMLARSAYATQVVGWIWQESTSGSKGQQVGWMKQWEQDHWLDTSYGCLVADSLVRTYSRRFRKAPPLQSDAGARGRFTSPDGRPYLVTDR